MKWEGMLLQIGVPSLGCPRGTNYHKLIISPKAAELMVEKAPGGYICWEHTSEIRGAVRIRGEKNPTKFGTITHAWIKDDFVMLRGTANPWYSFSISATKEEKFGMSFEVDGAHIADQRQKIWTVNWVDRFLGAAVLTNPSFKSDFYWI